MADLLLTAATPAPPAEATDLDALLDAVTAIKAQQKQLEQQLEPLLVCAGPSPARATTIRAPKTKTPALPF
jgi:hypothetical protein